MKKSLYSLLTFLVFSISALASQEKPLSILVIGGGPAGLATAIEASLSGFDVTIVEKRDAYTRENTLFLYTATLELFEKWGVAVPAMQELYVRDQRRGFVLIKDLEYSLAKRVHELGIHRIHGAFENFAEDDLAAIIQTPNGNTVIAFDILVGADGTHSKVREKLNISCPCLGSALAGVVMVPAVNAENKIGIEIRAHDAVFAKKVTIPCASLFFLQIRPGVVINTLTKQDIAQFVFEAGWQEEAGEMADAEIFHIDNIAVSLQRASAFSDPVRKVILVGDAASSASFYQGMGANFSFKTAEYAGEFFRQLPQDDAFDSFNQNMEKAASLLVDDSKSLFLR